MNNNNIITEIGVVVLSVALIAAMTVLLIVGKIDYVGAVPFLSIVAGLFGVNAAFKAPSPAQSTQLQTLFTQLLSALPGLFTQPPITIHNNIPASTSPAPSVQAMQSAQRPQFQSTPSLVLPAVPPQQ